MPQQTPATPLIAGVVCYLFWGFAPLVFQSIGLYGVGSWEILAHRSLWGVPVALLFVVMARQGDQVLRVLRNPPVLAGLAFSALLIGANWALYVWAVNAGNVLEASLGYYLTPLLNMLAGVVIFRERFDKIGVAAVLLAVGGIVLQGLALGHLPWISLILAASFGAYGVVRKLITADAQTGLLIECLYLAVPGAIYLAWMAQHGGGHFGTNLPVSAWLIACGPITAVPLVLFSWAARRLPLSTLGFLQFIGPTIGFAIGIAEGEAFTPLRALSFALIWGGAAVFIYGAWRRTRVLTPAAV